MATTSQNAQFFKVSNMRNLDFKSPVPKASFSLTILVGDGTLGGPQMRDCQLKSHNGSWWIDGKQEKASKPWTDRNGNTHEYSTINSFHKSHMDKELLIQLTDFIKGLYREDGNYEALNNPTTVPATAATPETAVANGANAATTTVAEPALAK